LPNTTGYFFFDSDAIKLTSPSNPYMYKAGFYSYVLKVHFRPCLYGEVQVAYGHTWSCYECKKNLYSLMKVSENNLGYCNQCPGT
jgi:hypothetical protein